MRNPASANTIGYLSRALMEIGSYSEAIEQLQKGSKFMRDNHRQDDAAQLQEYLNLAKAQKANYEK